MNLRQQTQYTQQTEKTNGKSTGQSVNAVAVEIGIMLLIGVPLVVAGTFWLVRLKAAGSLGELAYHLLTYLLLSVSVSLPVAAVHAIRNQRR